MLTTFFNRILLYSLAVWNFATVSSLELPTDLHDSNWNYNSEEGNGLIIFYKGKMVFNGKEVWNLVSLTGNFMSFQRNDKVTTDTSEKFLYKCWLYKRVTSSLYYFFPMTGMFQNQRAHVSADDPLDVCDYCTNTTAKLHILHPVWTPCECTPECSQLTISNKCTGANHNTSSTNCVSSTTAVEITTAIETTTTLPVKTTLSSTTTETKEAETTTLPITTVPLSSTATTTTLQITTTALSSTETTIKQTATINSIYLTTTLETTDPPATTTTAAALPTTIFTLQTTAETPNDQITSTIPTTSRPDEPKEETSTNHKKDISALDRIGLNEDAFVGVVSGSLLFVYLVIAIVGCACCVFILGRRRTRKRKEKESQENLVPEGANHFQNKSYLDSLPQVFHRIDE